MLLVICSFLFFGFFFFFISHVGLITSYSFSVLYRNLAQLVVCITAARSGGDFSKITKCGAADENGRVTVNIICRSFDVTCNWVGTADNPLKAKFGAGNDDGWCFPRALVPSGTDLLQRLTDFSASVTTNLPAYSTDIIACLKNTGQQCPMGCQLCSNIPAEAFPSTISALTQVCLPTALHDEYCEQIKEPRELILCQDDRPITLAGCATDCVYEPK